MENDKKSWTEYFRLITPFLVIVIGCIGWSVNMRVCQLEGKIDNIDQKLFVHLTNEQIHTPRGLVVSQEAFTLYQTMRDKQMQDVKETLNEVKAIILRLK